MSVELKLKALSAAEIASVVGGKLETYNGCSAEIPQTGLTTNSKEAASGVIFCAIKGSRVDGCDFIAEAARLGSTCFLCSRVPENAQKCGLPFCAVVVEDVVASLGTLAGWYRGLSKATFVAITGSVGKTTTKEFVAAVASAAFKTHKTHGNLNNELGMPLTIFDLSPDDEVSVIEMGMSALGEIEYTGDFTYEVRLGNLNSSADPKLLSLTLDYAAKIGKHLVAKVEQNRPLVRNRS